MEHKDHSDYKASLQETKREWAKKLHLFNEQELELYHQLDDMVPLPQVIAEIEEMFGPDGSAPK